MAHPLPQAGAVDGGMSMPASARVGAWPNVFTLAHAVVTECDVAAVATALHALTSAPTLTSRVSALKHVQRHCPWHVLAACGVRDEVIAAATHLLQQWVAAWSAAVMGGRTPAIAVDVAMLLDLCHTVQWLPRVEDDELVLRTLRCAVATGVEAEGAHGAAPATAAAARCQAVADIVVVVLEQWHARDGGPSATFDALFAWVAHLYRHGHGCTTLATSHAVQSSVRGWLLRQTETGYAATASVCGVMGSIALGLVRDLARTPDDVGGTATAAAFAPPTPTTLAAGMDAVTHTCRLLMAVALCVGPPTALLIPLPVEGKGGEDGAHAATPGRFLSLLFRLLGVRTKAVVEEVESWLLTGWVPLTTAAQVDDLVGRYTATLATITALCDAFMLCESTVAALGEDGDGMDGGRGGRSPTSMPPAAVLVEYRDAMRALALALYYACAAVFTSTLWPRIRRYAAAASAVSPPTCVDDLRACMWVPVLHTYLHTLLLLLADDPHALGDGGTLPNLVHVTLTLDAAAAAVASMPHTAPSQRPGMGGQASPGPASPLTPEPWTAHPVSVDLDAPTLHQWASAIVSSTTATGGDGPTSHAAMHRAACHSASLLPLLSRTLQASGGWQSSGMAPHHDDLTTSATAWLITYARLASLAIANEVASVATSPATGPLVEVATPPHSPLSPQAVEDVEDVLLLLQAMGDAGGLVVSAPWRSCAAHLASCARGLMDALARHDRVPPPTLPSLLAALGE